MPFLANLFFVYGLLQALGVTGTRNTVPKEDGGTMDYLMSRMEALEERVGKYRDETNSMKQKLENMAIVNMEQQQKIARLEGNQVPNQRTRQTHIGVATSFFASLQKNVSFSGIREKIAFDHVVTNNGNAYNPQTGVFTVPVDGTYVFSTTITVGHGNHAHIGIAHNGIFDTTMNMNGAMNSYDSTSCTIVLQAMIGDDVSVQSMDFNGNVLGNYFSLFSGYLLYTNIV